MFNYRDISYLAKGTRVQRLAYESLIKLGILSDLSRFDATLASTICNDIDIDGSDLDIVCEVYDFDKFETLVRQLYGGMNRFSICRSPTSTPSIVIGFFYEHFEFEVFAQAVPVVQQNCYRHMIQTSRVLSLGGELFRTAIRALKMQGLKTEPAVCRSLGIEGDPYRAVLDLERWSDEELEKFLRGGPKN